MLPNARYNQYEQHQPQPQPQQENLVRILGRLLGRIIATVGATTAARYLRKHYATIDKNTTEKDLKVRLLEELKDDSAVAAAAAFTWSTQIGGPTGADVSEYLFDRILNFTAPEITLLPRSAAPVVDRVTDSLLWRFTNYAANAIPEVGSIFQPAPQRQEGFRFPF